MQFLVEGRRKFVNEKTRYSNRLTDCLKMYYPQVLQWFCEVNSEIAGEFLQRWPTLEKLQKARPETVRKILCALPQCPIGPCGSPPGRDPPGDTGDEGLCRAHLLREQHDGTGTNPARSASDDSGL